MKKTFFKSLVFSIIIFAFSAKIFCSEIPENFFEFMLPNGMSVFVFEDFSTPLVHAEFCAKAGYETRNECDAPYFSLCSEIFSETGIRSQKNSRFSSSLESECTTNGAHFSIDCTGAELKSVFAQMSERAFAPFFSDEALQNALQKIKDQQISSTENFINSQINSRVFEEFSRQGGGSPYPPFSGQKNLSEIRSVVSRIFQEYYAPQKCAIFVSGAIKAKSVLHLALETFGKYAGRPNAADASFFIAKKNSAFGASDIAETDDLQAKKKVILCDKEFSSDFAQVVATISPLEKIKAQIAAAIFEDKNSALKNSLVQSDALAIRGSDYVNAAAATKKNLSRLVLQTLLEKSHFSSFEQIEIFEKILGEEICDFSKEDFNAAKENLIQDFYDSISNPKLFMENFSRFWADGIPDGKSQGETHIERFLSTPEKIAAENFADLKSALRKTEPWIFILLNENILSSYQGEFENSEYEIVSKKKDFAQGQNIENIAPLLTQENSLQAEIPLYNANFVAKSRGSTKSFSLSNGIRVTTKENPASSKMTVALYIFGGEAFDAESSYGMQSVLANVLEKNISDSLIPKISRGEISRQAQAKAFVSDTDFLIAIECETNEEKIALRCIGEGLFCSDFAPSQVDIALNARRARQILKTGSLARQMYSVGVRHFYKSPAYRALYSTQKEILKNLKYNDALESYQKFLDASRIEIIAAGNFIESSEKEFLDECEKIFGGLKKSKGKHKIFSEPNEASKSALAVRLEHTFLTDISADNALSRPAVLVPTTDFSDPVQFWIRSPKIFEEDAAIFDALILALEAQCKKIASEDARFEGIEVRLEERCALVSFGALTFFNVKKISDADFILRNSLERLRKNIFANSDVSLKNEEESDDVSTSFPDADFLEKEFFDGMKARWIKARYGERHETSEAVARIAHEISVARLSDNSQFQTRDAFTREYENVVLCENEKFREIWQKYFEEAPFKLYSLDSKK